VRVPLGKEAVHLAQQRPGRGRFDRFVGAKYPGASVVRETCDFDQWHGKALFNPVAGLNPD
jgi:hypothetical protein